MEMDMSDFIDVTFTVLDEVAEVVTPRYAHTGTDWMGLLWLLFLLLIPCTCTAALLAAGGGGP